MSDLPNKKKSSKYDDENDEYNQQRKRKKQKQRQRQKQRERSRQRQKQRRHKQRERERQKQHKHKEKEKQKEKLRDNSYSPQQLSRKRKQRDRPRNQKQQEKIDKQRPSKSLQRSNKSRSKDRKRQKQKKHKNKKDYHKGYDDKEDDEDKYRKSQSRQKQKTSRQKQRSRARDSSRDRQKKQRKEKDKKYRDQYRERDRSRDKEKKRRKDDYSYDDRRGGSSRKDKSHYRSKDRQRNYRQKQRQREKRQRFRFDSPPKSASSDMSNDPQKMNKLSQMKAAQQLVTSKADRKLYLGNLPPNITSTQLMQMLNSALKKMEVNTEPPGDSIISAWISPDGVGHYAFVQFRTSQEATNALALNGASLYGYQLKLGRPKQYIQYNKQLLSDIKGQGQMDQILKRVSAYGPIQLQPIVQRIVYPPSKLGIDQQYQQIFQDVHDMVKRYGQVIQLVIPRPHQMMNIQQMPKRVKGLGYAFIQYKSVDSAMKARKQLSKKMFSERSVNCSFFDQKRFKQGQYDVNQRVVIDF